MMPNATPDDIRSMADEIARLMADRLGGARRGEFPTLVDMIRRRGSALPRHLRRHADTLAQADAQLAAPRIARQMDPRPAVRAHTALKGWLQPLGSLSRWKDRSVNFLATLALGLLILGGLAVWIMMRRGLI